MGVERFFLHSFDKMHKVSAKPLEPSAPGFYYLKEIEPEQLLGWIGRFNPKILLKAFWFIEALSVQQPLHL